MDVGSRSITTTMPRTAEWREHSDKGGRMKLATRPLTQPTPPCYSSSALEWLFMIGRPTRYSVEGEGNRTMRP